MTTWCRQIRAALTAGELQPDAPEVAEHLGHCTSCATFAHRLGAFRAALRDHHAGVEPDAAFVARLRGRLPDSATDLMGRAALRLLPLGAAAVLGLGVALWMTNGELAPTGTSGDDTLIVDASGTTSPVDDPLGWLLESADDGTGR